MDTRRTFPFATLVLALTITVIHILRAMDGTYSELVTTTLRISGWASLYNQPWRTLTSPFLHKHLPHFLDNLCFLLLFGWPLERKYGRLVLLGTFFGALITSHVIYINVVGRWLVGISGGVSGLFGFFLIANRRTPWWTTLTHRPRHLLYSANLMFLLIADVIDWPASLGRVANLAHLVSILYGAAFAIALLLVPRLRWRGAVLALPLVLFASLSYSPWQAEWRLVQYGPTLVTTAADCNLESTEKEDSIPATTTFVDASTKAIAVYWLDYEGDASLISLLRPGESYVQRTFVGDAWCIVDVGSREALQAVIVTASGQTVTIR